MSLSTRVSSFPDLRVAGRLNSGVRPLMGILAILGLIIVVAGVVLCYFEHIWFGIAFILVGYFLVDLFTHRAMAAAVSKHRKETDIDTR